MLGVVIREEGALFHQLGLIRHCFDFGEGTGVREGGAAGFQIVQWSSCHGGAYVWRNGEVVFGVSVGCLSFERPTCLA